MKLGLVIRECHVLQTHLNWSRDFTGSLLRISITTSTGRYSDIVKREREIAMLLLRENKTLVRVEV